MSSAIPTVAAAPEEVIDGTGRAAGRPRGQCNDL
jgi:hypothetical protein